LKKRGLEKSHSRKAAGEERLEQPARRGFCKKVLLL